MRAWMDWLKNMAISLEKENLAKLVFANLPDQKGKKNPAPKAFLSTKNEYFV